MKVLRSNDYTKSYRGSYFVQGHGFTALEPAKATAFKDEEVAQTQECIASCGMGTSTAETIVVAADPNIKQNADGSSFAVYYIRKNQVRSDGSVVTHKNNPSKRRFATEDEANHHARRFVKIEGHVGFWLQKRAEAVNAYVNKVTGKTNPEIGKKRTNR